MYPRFKTVRVYGRTDHPPYLCTLQDSSPHCSSVTSTISPHTITLHPHLTPSVTSVPDLNPPTTVGNGDSLYRKWKFTPITDTNGGFLSTCILNKGTLFINLNHKLVSYLESSPSLVPPKVPNLLSLSLRRS